jgi:hypothetical protein
MKPLIASLFAASALVAGAPAVAQTPSPAPAGAPPASATTGAKPMNFSLKPQSDSGQTGTVTFTPEGQGTRVEISMSGAPASAQPAHVHDGSCAKIDPKPKFPLTDVVNGKSSTLVAAPMADLANGMHAINVHKSKAEASVYVACVDLTKP